MPIRSVPIRGEFEKVPQVPGQPTLPGLLVCKESDLSSVEVVNFPPSPNKNVERGYRLAMRVKPLKIIVVRVASAVEKS